MELDPLLNIRLQCVLEDIHITQLSVQLFELRTLPLFTHLHQDQESRV